MTAIDIPRLRAQQRASYHRLKRRRWKYFSLRLPLEDFEELRIVAAREQTSISELIRCAIVWACENE